MGLDITAYSRPSAVGKHTEDWCDEEDHVGAYDWTRAFELAADGGLVYFH